jgi:hypothetical protein
LGEKYEHQQTLTTVNQVQEDFQENAEGRSQNAEVKRFGFYFCILTSTFCIRTREPLCP